MSNVTLYSGLTWDHPRGANALRAGALLAAGAGLDIRWDAHSLEGFESTPLEDTAAHYDLVVLDHPHIGDAVAANCLVPMEQVVGEEVLADIARRAVGPSLESYQLAGRTWALPLDAATQVSARRADLLPDEPVTWADIVKISTVAPVALSLAGPHAYLTFASVCQSYGAPLADGRADQIVDIDVAEQALSLLAGLASRAPSGSQELNPIGLLGRMTTTDDIALIPLVYGYVGYACGGSFRPITYGASPTGTDRQIGSTIGGTGIAVTRRAVITDALRDHLIWLLDDATQTQFITAHDGQPSVIAAWESESVNHEVNGFYHRTRATIQSAWTRPRFAGFPRIQTHLASVVRDALRNSTPAAEVVGRLTQIQNMAVAQAREETLT